MLCCIQAFTHMFDAVWFHLDSRCFGETVLIKTFIIGKEQGKETQILKHTRGIWEKDVTKAAQQLTL